MIISYHGADFFKVAFGDTTIAVNPISKDSKIKGARFGSDIALVSLLTSPEHNGVDAVSRGDKEAFVISGPGEYEVGGVFIKGFLSKSNYGGEERLNTIYTVQMEGMSLCFFGALGDEKLSSEVKEGIGTIDVLFAPIGGEGVLDPSAAYKLALQFEPKIIIPSHYAEVGDKNALKAFLKESGAEKVSPADKLTLKKKDLEGKDGEIIVLEAA